MQGKKIDWLNHVLEFSVVLIGILIAFQLNKCSDDRAKTSLLRHHLQYIQLECQENIKRLATAIDHTQEQLRMADSLATAIHQQQDPNRVRNFAAKLLDLRKVDLLDESYRVLAASGDIRYFKDYEKKRAIITLYETFEQVKTINQNTQKLYDDHYYPYLKQHFDLVNWTYLQTNGKESFKAYYSLEFGNIVSTYIFLLNSKLRTYEKEKKRLATFLTEYAAAS